MATTRHGMTAGGGGYRTRATLPVRKAGGWPGLRRSLALACLAMAFTLPAATLAQPPLADAGEPLTLGTSHVVSSRILAQDRRVNILLPDGYDDPEHGSARYPVLYLLDGGAGWQDFMHIAAMVQQGGRWGGNAPMIVVGIESGDRQAEFTAPSSDPAEQADFPTSGKAAVFRQFLVHELQPAVDAAFRTDGTTGIMGESLAGLFVVDTALHEPGAFDRYIAVSPSLWWNRGALAAEAPSLVPRMGGGAGRVWLSMGDEGGRMQAGMDRLVQALAAAAPARLDWAYVPFPDETHATIYHPAAIRAIRAMFPAPPITR